MEHTSSPSQFYKSTFAWNGNGWDLRLKDGNTYVFGNVAPLQSLRDRNGNSVRLFRSNGTSGNITLIVSPDGRFLEFFYNSPNCSNCVSQVVDNGGRTVNYEYDSTGHLTTIKASVDALNPTKDAITTYAYDFTKSDFPLLSVKEPNGQLTGKFKVVNKYRCPDPNQTSCPGEWMVGEQTYADGTTNRFSYSLGTASGKVTQTEVTDERGHKRVITYNADGYPLTDTHAAGKPEQQTTTFIRLADNRVDTVTDALGRITQYGYDAMGNITHVTRLYGTPWATTWNLHYEPTYNQLDTFTDPLNRTIKLGYDAQGNLTQVTDNLGHAVDATYLAGGRLHTVTRHTGTKDLTTTYDWDGGDLVAVTDPLGRTVQSIHDAIGRPIATIDPVGDRTVTTYDDLDRVTQITRPDGTFVQYDYDGNGNLKTFTDAKKNITQFTYDDRDRLKTRTDPLLRVETYDYDDSGNVRFKTARDGKVTGYIHDPLNRPTQVGFGATSTTAPVYRGTIGYTWDGANRLRQATDSVNGIVKLTYDDRFDTVYQDISPQGTVTTVRHANSLRAWRDVTGGTRLTYGYDQANRLRTLTQTAGTGPAQPAAAQTAIVGYDDANRLTSLTLPNGLKAIYTLDDAGQLRNLSYWKTGHVLLGNLAYTYDDRGLIATRGGTLGGTLLTPATTAPSQHDANNALKLWNNIVPAYDLNGQLTQLGGQQYKWNPRGQLTRFTAGTTTATFQYDALGRRRSKTVNGVTTQYLHDGLTPIQEQDGSGQVKANTLTGPGIDQYLTRYQNGQSYSYVTDVQGTTLRLTDAAQAVVATYRYDPYGNTSTDNPTLENPYQYTGRENDGTGLYYYRARYYHPRLNRFISEDPIGLAGGDNLYAYVGNNPLKWVDPLGLVNIDPTGPFGPWGFEGGRGVGGGGGGGARFAIPAPTPSPAPRGVPMRAPPNSCYGTPKGDVRVYDRYGNRSYDLDFSHAHEGLIPHAHNWANGVRDVDGLEFTPLFSPLPDP